MIKSLHIKNAALIKDAVIEFCGGLNVLSGETGAGKTMLIGAINFALGSKADKSLIRFGEKVMEAEAVFSIDEDSFDLKAELNDIGVDYDDELIVRRRIFEDGRGDIRINGVQVTLQTLKKVTENLVDVYGQSEHYYLLKDANQLKVLDAFAGAPLADIKCSLKPVIEEVKTARLKLSGMGGDEKSRAMRADILKYQINEIEKAELKIGEEEELAEKKKIFDNVEKIGEAFGFLKEAFGGDGGAVDIIGSAINKISDITDLGAEYATVYDRLYSLKAEADDIGSEAANIVDSLDFDSQEYARIDERLDLIKSLKRKYGGDIEEVLNFLRDAESELDNIENYEIESQKLEKVIENDLTKIKGFYKKATELRKVAASEFSDKIEAELKLLGMKSAKFNISVTAGSLDVLSENGADKVEFSFSANAGEPLKPMNKIISGGELSRFMLAMKLVYSGEQIKTYLFDEIDAGISGRASELVSEKFAEISLKKQVITISHLPIMVSFADKSFLIEKSELNGVAETKVTPLDDSGVINEIIRITDGGSASETARKHAEEILNSAKTKKAALKT